MVPLIGKKVKAFPIQYLFCLQSHGCQYLPVIGINYFSIYYEIVFAIYCCLSIIGYFSNISPYY